MCGLAAYFAYHPAAAAVDRDALSRVAGALRVRGPDGDGAWHGADGRVGLHHTRLAIIGPGEQGAQPMRSQCGRLAISFNGEIYNHRALRAELENDGHRFRGDSDTEVLLALYARDGEAMLPRLRGMFAFALWDGRSGELVLARDAYGIKPLYYADDGWTIRAASQVKALRSDAAVDQRACTAGWAGFWLLGSVPEPFTVCRGVRALPAGCVLRVTTSGVPVPRRWFDLAGTLRDAPPAQAPLALLRDALLDSVRHHLVADVPLGLFLSAGQDSGTLLALCRELGARPLAVTVSFEAHAGSEADEAAGARECARRYGVEHHVERIGTAELESAQHAILDAMDQPSIDGINTWFVSRAAARLGLKAALSGVGGDELLGGYPSFRQLPWAAPLSRALAGVPLLGEGFRRVAQPLVARAGLHPKLAGVLASGGGYPGAYLLRRGVYMPWELPAIMGEAEARDGLARLDAHAMLASLLRPDPGSARGRVTVLESAVYLRNQLLRDADWAGMAHGLEVRTPLVDAHLLRAVAPVISGRASREGKRLLAQVPARRLPDSLTGRERTGFQVPLDAWLARRATSAAGAVPRHVAAVRTWAGTVAAAA